MGSIFDQLGSGGQPLYLSSSGRVTGEPVDLSNSDASGWLDGLNATAAEVGALDQVMAEVAELPEPDPFAGMTLDEIIADAEAELGADGIGLANPPDSTVATAASLRQLAGRLRRDHPAMDVHQHVSDAADVLEQGSASGALGHLRAAHSALAPHALRLHGITDLDGSRAAARSQDAVTRHVLLVRDLQDARGQASPALASPAGQAIELAASTAIGDVLDRQMHQAAAQRAAAQDDAPSGRSGTRRAPRHMPTSENVLAAALDRVASGTYWGQDSALALATPTSEAGRALAGLRWRQHQADPMAAVTGGQPCGHVDALGRCGSRYHDAACSSLATPEITEALRPAMAQIASRPALAGSTGTLADHLEAMTGQRTRPAMFETGQQRPGVFSPEHRAVLSDPDADDRERYPAGLPDVAGIRGRMGIPADDGASRRETYAAERERMLARQRQATGGMRHPDFGETTRERAGRMRRPVHPVPVEQPADGLTALPQYTAGTGL